MEISEGDDLPSQLSIIKNGQHEPDISFQVTITPETDHLDENGKRVAYWLEYWFIYTSVSRAYQTKW